MEVSLLGDAETNYSGINFKLLHGKLDDVDLTVVQLIANQNYLYRVSDSFKQATKSFNSLKSYYFMFNAYIINSKKLYTGTDIYRLKNAFLTNRINWKEKYYWEYNYLHKIEMICMLKLN